MPAEPTPDQFREAMAALPTGVTVVSAPAPDGPVGATANAVTSLSLEPPLMLAALDDGSRTLAAIRAARRFGVSVLGAGQEEVARAFATKAPHAEKWADVGGPPHPVGGGGGGGAAWGGGGRTCPPTTTTGCRSGPAGRHGWPASSTPFTRAATTRS